LLFEVSFTQRPFVDCSSAAVGVEVVGVGRGGELRHAADITRIRQVVTVVRVDMCVIKREGRACRGQKKAIDNGVVAGVDSAP
jgi:hypothetical protein